MNIKFGILGCGHIAGRHVKHITDHAEGEVVGCFDIKPERTKAFAEKENIKKYSQLQEMLDDNDIDIISVCTPNGAHCEAAIAVLNAGKHVIVEKPMALSTADCEEMIKAAFINNKQLFVVKQNRYNPPVKALKDLMDSGNLGEVYYVTVNCFWNRNEDYYKKSDWKGTMRWDGGTLFTQFSHFIDIFYYLFGDIDNVTGMIKNVNHQGLIEFEDTGSFTFSLKNGAMGSLNYTTASYGQNMEGSITVFAENATIKVGGQYLNVLEYQKTSGFEIGELPVSGPANDYGFYQGSMSNHDKMIGNVIDTLKGRDKIMTNAMEGLKVVEIIEKMYNSTKSTNFPNSNTEKKHGAFL